MKFLDDYRLEKAVEKDGYREALAHAHLDVEAKRAVATNGHLLASVPVEVTSADRTGPIPSAALKCARADHVKARKGLVQNGRTLWVRPPRLQFPDWRKVVPSYRKGEKDHVTICINPKFLAALMEAIGEHGRGRTQVVTLTFPKPDAEGKMLEPIVVERLGETDENSPLGVLMPARWW